MRFGSSLKRSKNVDLELFITRKSSNSRKQSLVEPNCEGDDDIVENSNESSKGDSYSSNLAPTRKAKI